MSEKSIELAVEVPPETRLAIERAAAAQGMSVSEFIQDTLQSYWSKLALEASR